MKSIHIFFRGEQHILVQPIFFPYEAFMLNLNQLMNDLYSMKIKNKILLLSSEFLLASKGKEKDACLHYGDRCYASPCSTCRAASTISILCTSMLLNLVKKLIIAVKRLRKNTSEMRDYRLIFYRGIQIKIWSFSLSPFFLAKNILDLTEVLHFILQC